MAQTTKIIQNAISVASSIYTSMDSLANATTLTWPNINSVIEKARTARDPVTLLLTASADADRDVASQFSIEVGVPYTVTDIQTVFTTSTAQTEAFNDAAFVLFDANNTRERVLADPGDPNSDRIAQEVVFGSPDIDAIKAAAAAVRDTLADFAP